MLSTALKSAATPASKFPISESVSKDSNSFADTKSSKLDHADSDVLYYANGVKTLLTIATGDTSFGTAVYPGSSSNSKVGACMELNLVEKELTESLVGIHTKAWEKVENGRGRATVDKLNTEMNDILNEQEESSKGLFERFPNWKISQVDNTSSFGDLVELEEQVKSHQASIPRSENGVLLIPKPQSRSISTVKSESKRRNHISMSPSRMKLWKRQTTDDSKSNSSESKIEWSQCKSYVIPHPRMTCSIDESQRRIAAFHQQLSKMTFPSNLSEDEIIEKVQNEAKSVPHDGIGYKFVQEETLDLSCLRPIVEL